MGVMPGKPCGVTWLPWFMHWTRGDSGHVSDGGHVPPQAPSLYKSLLMVGGAGSGGRGVSPGPVGPTGGACVYMPPWPKHMQGPPPRALCVCACTNKQIKGDVIQCGGVKGCVCVWGGGQLDVSGLQLPEVFTLTTQRNSVDTMPFVPDKQEEPCFICRSENVQQTDELIKQLAGASMSILIVRSVALSCF